MAEIGAVCPDKVSSPERAKTFQSFTLQSSDPVASVRESVLKQELLMLPRCLEQTRMILPVSVLNIFEVPSKQPVASKCPLGDAAWRKSGEDVQQDVRVHHMVHTVHIIHI